MFIKNSRCLITIRLHTSNEIWSLKLVIRNVLKCWDRDSGFIRILTLTVCFSCEISIWSSILNIDEYVVFFLFVKSLYMFKLCCPLKLSICFNKLNNESEFTSELFSMKFSCRRDYQKLLHESRNEIGKKANIICDIKILCAWVFLPFHNTRFVRSVEWQNLM